jgi:integrase
MRKRTGYLIKRGRTYYAVWTVGGRKFKRSTGKVSRRDALVELHRIMEPFVAGDEVATLQNIQARIEGRKAELVHLEDERNPPLRLDRAWIAYEDSPSRPDSGDLTMGDYKRHLAAFVKWCQGKHPEVVAMRDVTAAIAGEYAAYYAKTGRSPNRFNKVMQGLSLVFRVLSEIARLASNPWERIQRKRAVSHSRRELTIEELAAVIEKADGELRPLLALGIFTGLRLGDCVTLRWAETDLVAGVIRRIPSKSVRRNPKPVIIPIHVTLGRILGELPRDREYVLPESAEHYQRDSSRFCRRIQDHFHACGIKTHKPGTGPGTGKRAVLEVGFHSLRHSFVSLCRAANVPLAVVEAIVGHSNPAMTRYYTHVGEDAARAAVAMLPAVIGDTPAAAIKPVRLIDAAKVRALAERLDGKNWKRVRAEMLRLS